MKSFITVVLSVLWASSIEAINTWDYLGPREILIQAPTAHGFTGVFHRLSHFESLSTGNSSYGSVNIFGAELSIPPQIEGQNMTIRRGGRNEVFAEGRTEDIMNWLNNLDVVLSFETNFHALTLNFSCPEDETECQEEDTLLEITFYTEAKSKSSDYKKAFIAIYSLLASFLFIGTSKLFIQSNQRVEEIKEMAEEIGRMHVTQYNGVQIEPLSHMSRNTSAPSIDNEALLEINGSSNKSLSRRKKGKTSTTAHQDLIKKATQNIDQRKQPEREQSTGGESHSTNGLSKYRPVTHVTSIFSSSSSREPERPIEQGLMRISFGDEEEELNE